MVLDPSESINNMGTLRVDVLDAKHLPSADHNGYSNPLCKFYLDGKTIFKTGLRKKTLDPAWNEVFECKILSRTAARLVCDVHNWKSAFDSDSLGAATVNLETIEPFKPQEYQLALDRESGTVRLRLLFKPEYVTRKAVRGYSRP